MHNEDQEQNYQIMRITGSDYAGFYQEELLTLEGTRYTLSSTNDFNEELKSINSINGYKEAMKVNGVYAIHIKYIIN